MSGVGTTRVGSGASLTISGTAQKNLRDGRVFENGGNGTWTGPGLIWVNSGSGTFRNLAGGLFDVQNDVQMAGGHYESLAVENAGTWRKTGGPGVSRGTAEGAVSGNHARPTVALRGLAGIMALTALGLTALHLATPRLAISTRTLSIARPLLVPPRAGTDFEFLAAQPIWSDQPLGALLEQVELANYNRELVNWKLDDQLYREFVLSPQIDPAFDGAMDWRRPLWEYFYPQVRKVNSLGAAADIVVHQLREQVAITDRATPPQTIADIWTRQITDERGCELIAVAALRSVGIPARGSGLARAEFWNGSEWKPMRTAAATSPR
jgi:hypothetical protein